MVMTPEQAAEKYRTGITAFGGAAQYQTCGARKAEGFLAVARCLEEAKKVALTTDIAFCQILT